MQETDGRPHIVLASSSPRRRELLRQIGVAFRVIPADVDEAVLPGEQPAEYVLRVARDKAEAVWARTEGALPVLAADTAVVVEGCILGKPTDRAEAVAMLRRLSDRTHEVFSAVAVRAGPEGAADRVNVTRVTFGPLESAWIEAYCDTGEPMDKAGAYGVQGAAAARIVRIGGSFSGVMGLPLYETSELLRRFEVLS